MYFCPCRILQDNYIEVVERDAFDFPIHDLSLMYAFMYINRGVACVAMETLLSELSIVTLGRRLN